MQQGNILGTIALIFQALQKQKRKTEEEKSVQSSLEKDNQSLVKSCDELERKLGKIEHEIQTRDSRIGCLEGQLTHTKQALEAETNKVNDQYGPACLSSLVIYLS